VTAISTVSESTAGTEILAALLDGVLQFEVGSTRNDLSEYKQTGKDYLNDYLTVTGPLFLKLHEADVLKRVPGYCAIKLRIWAYGSGLLGAEA